MDITIYPYDKMLDGEDTFKAPITVKGVVLPKEVIIINRQGRQVVSQSAIYLPGDVASQLSPQDEFAALFTPRSPSSKFNPYYNLAGQLEIIEVLL
jgi:NADPH-dependent 2,4-dienoyl-CoA reductase/sulfur reductase-like enzyme